jgi:hypothetical protein
MLFLNSSISQVLKLVPQLIQVVILTTDPDVRLIVKPNFKRFYTSDEYPLPDIKLLFENDQRPLNVLLCDEARVFGF